MEGHGHKDSVEITSNETCGIALSEGTIAIGEANAVRIVIVFTLHEMPDLNPSEHDIKVSKAHVTMSMPLLLIWASCELYQPARSTIAMYTARSQISNI